MPYAVTLPLDDTATAEMQRILDALSNQGVADDVLRLGYRPHVTLAIMPDTAPVAEVEKATFNVVSEWGKFSMTLAGLGVFPGAPAIIWAAPVVTAMLLAKHAELHSALKPYDVHGHYAPRDWVPHVTLTKEGSASSGKAIDAAASVWRGPFGTMVDRVDLVSFRPVNVIRSEALQR